MSPLVNGLYLNVEILCEGLQFPEGPIALDNGDLLFVEIAAGKLSRLSKDGRHSTAAELGGGPNGAAIGPDGAIYVCNNGGIKFHREPGHMRTLGIADNYSGGRIERVDLRTGKVDRLYASCDGHDLNGPNDIVFDAHGGFYFTDLGKTRARYRDRGAVYYALPDGSKIRELVYGLTSPNGIGLSPDGDVLYVTETEPGRLWKWRIEAPGKLEKLPYPSPNGGMLVHGAGGYQRFDSLAVEANGHVCLATLGHGGVTVVQPQDGFWLHVPMPDSHTTNICFGGDDLRDAYVTLSSGGRLGRIRWPRPGLRLNFADLYKG